MTTTSAGHRPPVPGRPTSLRLLTAALVAAVSVACGGTSPSTPATGEAAPVTTLDGSSRAAAPTTTSTTSTTSPIAAAIVPAGSARFEPRPEATLAAPTRLRVDGIGVRDAPVVAVGVDAAGAFAVPAVDDVGWYRFGPRPGDTGSAVLAAHIAFDGVDGVFRRLASVAPGAAVEVGFADGTSRRFTVTTIERIDKDELPQELFATTGAPRLVLITCGGAFDRDRRSYEDNIIVIAVPEGAAAR